MGFKRIVIALILMVVPLPLMAQDPVAIRGTNVVDVLSGAVSSETTILIRNGLIEAIGPDSTTAIPGGAHVLDGSGAWAIPGLIEVHSHSVDEAVLKGALALGVTTSLTIYIGESSPEIGQWSANPESPTPRLEIVAGRFSAEFPGSLVPGLPLQGPSTPDAARTAIEEVESQNFRNIKIWQDDGMLVLGAMGEMEVLKPEVVETLIEEAHKRDMRVYVHAWQREYYRQLLTAGADWFIHPVTDRLLRPSDFETLKSRGLGWTPTAASLLWTADPRAYARRVLSDDRLRRTLSDDELSLRESDANAIENPALGRAPEAVRNLGQDTEVLRVNTLASLDAGLVISVGSDISPGTGTHLEMELMAELGLSPQVVLQAATHGGAVTLGLTDEVGTLEAGKRGDVILLNSDPLDDVRNIRNVRVVVKGGHVWAPEEILPARN